MKYRAKEIDGEWLVVDENEDIVADAADRRDAITMANAMTRESSNADSKPNIHRGSSYGNKPEAELDEGVSDNIDKALDYMYELTDNGQMPKNAYHNAKTKFKLSDTEAEEVLDNWNDSHKFNPIENINEDIEEFGGESGAYSVSKDSMGNVTITHDFVDPNGKHDGKVSMSVYLQGDEATDFLRQINRLKTNKVSEDKFMNFLSQYDDVMEESLEEATKQGADEDAANELVLYAESDSDLYKQSALPIVANLQRKVKKGNYDPELAIKLWRYHADRAAKKYFKEFPDGNDFTFSPATRDLAAKEFRDNYEEHVMEAKPQDVKEENLQELSKGTLKSYVKKAAYDSSMASFKQGKAVGNAGTYHKRPDTETANDMAKRSLKRERGIDMAVDKLTEAAPRITPDEAKSILDELGYQSGDSKDFFTLRSSEVSKLLDHAKRLKYRKSKYAPGSTARMFYQYLTRLANKSGSSENIQEAYEKLTDKQLQDKFVSLKVKSKDLSKDSKDSKELQKIRDEIAKRKSLKKESVESQDVMIAESTINILFGNIK
jgi:hypothetical protein